MDWRRGVDACRRLPAQWRPDPHSAFFVQKNSHTDFGLP